MLSLKSNLGYGGGILAGLESSQGSIIAWTHADLQTDIKDVYRGFDYLKERNIKDNFLGFVEQHKKVLIHSGWALE